MRPHVDVADDAARLFEHGIAVTGYPTVRYESGAAQRIGAGVLADEIG